MTDAIVLLRNDHKAVEKLFKRFEGLGDDDLVEKRSVVDEVLAELATHTRIEEEVFYPAVREALPDEEDTVLEGYEEHHVVKGTLAELADLAPDAERFDAKVTVLIEMVRHHVEEEEQEMFPAVREAMGRKALQELGATMETAKTQG